MTGQTKAVVKHDPPPHIAEAPFALDDLIFTPNDTGRIERAARGVDHVGDVLLDDNRFWFARKRDAHGELSDWRPMRCAAEARAFLVSGIKL